MRGLRLVQSVRPVIGCDLDLAGVMIMLCYGCGVQGSDDDNFAVVAVVPSANRSSHLGLVRRNQYCGKMWCRSWSEALEAWPWVPLQKW